MLECVVAETLDRSMLSEGVRRRCVEDLKGCSQVTMWCESWRLCLLTRCQVKQPKGVDKDCHLAVTENKRLLRTKQTSEPSFETTTRIL
jgi:hypothetical protein